jgi:uncharacterized repeat protein (TIGR01451 family)
VVQGVDLSVTQTVNPNPAFVNSQVSFVISVSNMSSTTATNVVVTDTLPASLTNIKATSTSGTVLPVSGNTVTVNIPQLPPTGITGAGSSAVITITATTPGTAGNLTNSVTATATQPQTVANDNISTVTFTVQTGTQPSDQAPQVSTVTRTGTGDQPSRLKVVFNSPLNAASASRIQNYKLLSAGADGQFGTADDRKIALAGAKYDSATNTVTVTAFSPYSRHLLTQLTVVGQPNRGVQGTNGLFLAGSNGQAGTNYVVRIRGAGPVTATRVTRAYSRPRA